eukprot:m.429988 g.429988  ORF g.429988 m.429988 type:complete len:61 (+) comp17102_c0_seq1:531-713(+)
MKRNHTHLIPKMELRGFVVASVKKNMAISAVLGTFGAYAWYSGVYKYQIDQIAAYKAKQQ